MATARHLVARAGNQETFKATRLKSAEAEETEEELSRRRTKGGAGVSKGIL